MTTPSEISDELVAQLREAAEKATPGPWKVWAMEVLADPVGDSNLDTALPVARTTDTRYEKPRTFNANYIALMDPPMTLALLDALDGLPALLERVEAAEGAVRMKELDAEARLKQAHAGYEAADKARADLAAKVARVEALAEEAYRQCREEGVNIALVAARDLRTALTEGTEGA